jgi:hypothetical protein
MRSRPAPHEGKKKREEIWKKKKLFSPLFSSSLTLRSSGISPMSNVAPSSSPSHVMLFICTRSTTPWNPSSAPIGSVSTSGLAPRFPLIMSTVRKKLAPMRSILLTKQMRGTPYLSAWRQTVSDCGSTPATLSNSATAPSSTRRARSTSSVKSTWPGVSMMLMRCPSHSHVVAAEVMVMPRSCSCSIQSMVAAPGGVSFAIFVVSKRGKSEFFFSSVGFLTFPSPSLQRGKKNLLPSWTSPIL